MLENSSENDDLVQEGYLRAEDQLMQRIDEKKEELLSLMTSMQNTIKELTQLRFQVSHDIPVETADEPQKDRAGHDLLQRKSHEANVLSSDEQFLRKVYALKAQLASIEKPQMDIRHRDIMSEKEGSILETTTLTNDWKWPLSSDDYKRYGRQLIMPEIGLKGTSPLPYEGFSLLTRTRPTPFKSVISSNCRCWRSRVSSSRLSSRRRHRHRRTRGRRHR